MARFTIGASSALLLPCGRNVHILNVYSKYVKIVYGLQFTP